MTLIQCFTLLMDRRLAAQDALTKTIPIWAAVLNRAAALVRRRQDDSAAAHVGHPPASAQQPASPDLGGDGTADPQINSDQQSGSCPHLGIASRQLSEAADAAGTASPAAAASWADAQPFCTAAQVQPGTKLPPAAGWDTALHLPLWISSNERLQIEQRVDGWVQELLGVRFAEIFDEILSELASACDPAAGRTWGSVWGAISGLWLARPVSYVCNKLRLVLTWCTCSWVRMWWALRQPSGSRCGRCG